MNPAQLFIHTDGNDNNDGLTNTASGAFASVQRAIQEAYSVCPIQQNLDIMMSDGVYTGDILHDRPFWGGGIVTLRGNPLDRSAVTLTSTTTGPATIIMRRRTELAMADLKLKAGINKQNVTNLTRGLLFLTRVDLEIQGCQTALVTGDQGCIDMTGDSVFTGSGAGLSYCSSDSYQRLYAGNMTIANNPAYAYFIRSRSGSLVRCTFTFTGNASTGCRYQIDANSVIDVVSGSPLTYLPGTRDGEITSGGRYNNA